jgi:hypothetical protein
VPTFVPVVAPVDADGAEGTALPAAGEVGGAAVAPVWANAEVATRTAPARENRKNLLVIGSFELLGT